MKKLRSTCQKCKKKRFQERMILVNMKSPKNGKPEWECKKCQDPAQIDLALLPGEPSGYGTPENTKKFMALVSGEDTKTMKEVKRRIETRKAKDNNVSVLYVREDSVYKNLGVDCWDITRDARKWQGGNPLIAHPPCRAWGKLATFAKPRPDEKELAVHSVKMIRKNGGVLEHPAASKLWKELNLPKPGEKDEFGGFSILVNQFDFGHKAEKKTLLYIVGTELKNIPQIPSKQGTPEYVINTNKRVGDDGYRKSVSKKEREATPLDFALFLIDIARNCKAPGKPKVNFSVPEAPLEIGDIIKTTTYGTGPYRVTKVTDVCTCPRYLDTLGGNNRAMAESSPPHFHFVLDDYPVKTNSNSYLGGFIKKEGRIVSVWCDDEIIIQPKDNLPMAADPEPEVLALCNFKTASGVTAYGQINRKENGTWTFCNAVSCGNNFHTEPESEPYPTKQDCAFACAGNMVDFIDKNNTNSDSQLLYKQVMGLFTPGRIPGLKY